MNHITTLFAALILCLITTGAAFANQIHPVSGAYYTSEVDLKVAARGIPMAWERTYRSNRTILKINSLDDKSYQYKAPVDGPLGFGWHSPFTMHIVKNAPIVSDPAYLCDALVDADGTYIYFEKGPGGIILPNYANGYTLSGGNGGNYTLTQRGGNTWTFDSNGRLLTIADLLGRTARLTYSGDQLTGISAAAGRTVYTLTWSDNHISKVTDLSGRAITYSYTNGNLASVSHDSDTIFSYTYNSDHGLITNSNAQNETWRIGYRYPTSDGLALRLSDPNIGTTSHAYDFRSNSVSIKDPAGNSRTQIRNNSGQLTSEREGNTNTLTVAYLGGGLRTLTDADGNITSEYRDQWDNVTKRIDPEGGITQYSYNANGKPTGITDAEGSTTSITYDDSGSLPTQITRAQGTGDQTITTFSYDNGDLKETGTDGAATSFTYNNAGLPLTITAPEGNVTTLAYDLIGNLLSSTDATGNKTEYSYDWRGNLLTTKDGEGNITTYSYTAADRLQTVTDPKGNATSTTTDFSGRITSITAPSGTTSFGYDGNGNLKSVTRGDATTGYAYDSKNRVTTTTDPEGNKTTYAYANGGGTCSTCSNSGTNNTTPTVITDPLNNITTNTLDKLGRIKQISDPLNNLTNLAYDKVGRVTTRTDANGNQTTYTYDKLGRITSQTNAEGGVTSFTYDKRGNLLTLTDPENNTTIFEYDNAGRKTKEIRPEGQATKYAYYANGLLKTVKDAKGQTTTYTYDKANRLTETSFNDNTKHTFGFDKNGNLISYATPDVSATLDYDRANRRTSETVTIGAVTKTYSYSYDTKGNKATFTSPEGITYSYTYNKNDQPTQIATPAGQISMDYNWVRNTKVTLPNGVITDFSYNGNSWLTGVAAQKAATAVVSAAYGFDKVGNITSKATDVTTVYGYDKTYQLLNSTNPQNSETFTYDKVGNRKTKQETQTPWMFNKNNELKTADTISYGYDDNGNTTSITNSIISTNSTTVFSYKASDRLTTVQLPDGRIVTYTYDPFGRRIKKQVGTETTLYVSIEEGLIGEYTAQGTATKTYGWRPNGIWGTNPVFQLENGQYYFYHNDHLGTPQSMTDAAGDIVWEASYEALKEQGRFSTVFLTAGSMVGGARPFDDEVDYYIAILKEVGRNFRTHKFPSQMIGTAFNKDQLKRLYAETGLTSYTSDIEVLDEELFNRLCPGKAEWIGYKEWKRRLVAAVDVFGPGRVNTGLVAGIELAGPYGFCSEDEALARTLSEAEDLARQGVSTVFIVWSPRPDTPLGSYKNASLDYYIRLARGLHALRVKYRLPIDHDSYRNCGNHPDTDLSRLLPLWEE